MRAVPGRENTPSAETIQRLRESEELYARAFMSNPVAMSLTDTATGRFTHVNSAFAELVGYTRSEIIGKTSEEMRFWPDRGERERVAKRIEQGDDMPLTEGQIRVKSGRTMRVLVSFRLFPTTPEPTVLSVLVPMPE